MSVIGYPATGCSADQKEQEHKSNRFRMIPPLLFPEAMARQTIRQYGRT
jgi:hypothetical protein